MTFLALFLALVLHIDILELFKLTKGGAQMNGFVENGGEVYKINSESGLKKLMVLATNTLR